MSLPVPVVGVAPGPNYAADVNNCLGLVDSHDHSFGRGVQITPAGLDISNDLSIQQNNVINIRSLRFFPQTVPLVGISPDLNCLYDTLGDLYFNDGSGNQVRITQSGGVAGSPGSIANLTSPASASYSAGTQTFIWQSDVNTAANMDMGSIILRDLTANSFGVTINPPAALASDYSLTLPASLPGSTSIVTIDNSGNIGTPGVYPLTSPSIANQAITQAKLAPRSTGITVPAGGVAVSVPISIIINVPTALGLNISLVTTGRPVFVSIQAAPGVGLNSNVDAHGGTAIVRFTRNGTEICSNDFGPSGPSNAEFFLPPSAFSVLDMGVNGSPGTYTYDLTIEASGGTQIILQSCILVAYEI